MRRLARRALRQDQAARRAAAAQAPARARPGRAPARDAERRKGRAAELAALLSRALVAHRRSRAKPRRWRCSPICFGGGQTSLLYRTLVLDQAIAVVAGAHYMGTALDETRFFLYAMPNPDVTMEALDAAIDGIARAIHRRRRRRGGAGARQDAARRRRDLCAGQPGDAGALVRVFARDRAQTMEDIRQWPTRIEAVDAASIVAAAQKHARSPQGRHRPPAARSRKRRRPESRSDRSLSTRRAKRGPTNKKAQMRRMETPMNAPVANRTAFTHGQRAAES